MVGSSKTSATSGAGWKVTVENSVGVALITMKPRLQAQLSYMKCEARGNFSWHRKIIGLQIRPSNDMSLPRTITFQPAEDVRRIINAKLRSFSPKTRRGVKTRIINEAIRLLVAEKRQEIEVGGAR